MVNFFIAANEFPGIVKLSFYGFNLPRFTNKVTLHTSYEKSRQLSLDNYEYNKTQKTLTITGINIPLTIKEDTRITFD